MSSCMSVYEFNFEEGQRILRCPFSESFVPIGVSEDLGTMYLGTELNTKQVEFISGTLFHRPQ